MIMEIRKIWPRIFYGWLVLFMMSGPLLGQDGPNVTMVLHPNDNPQMISRFGWDQQIFWVRVTNNEPSSIQYRIVYRLQISNSSITPGTIMTGRTRVGTKQWDGENGHGYLASHSGENIYNNDYSRIEELNVDIGSGPEFNDIVSRTGTLPPGDYELIVELQAKYWSDDDELYFIDPPPVETLYHEWRIVIPVPPLLFIPSDESVIEVTNPTFSWYSLRTASGIKFLYNIRICLVEEGQSKEEAMDNLTHWTNDWDIDHTHIGGQDNIRKMWHNYFENADAVVFVIDSNDRDRFKAVKDELGNLVNHRLLRECPFLIFANKQDLPRAMSANNLSDALNLHRLMGHNNWKMVNSTATMGKGIDSRFKWLSSIV